MEPSGEVTRFDHAATVGAWADEFGDERTVVVPFEQPFIRHGVTMTLLERYGIETGGLPVDDIRTNAKVGLKALHAVRYVRDRCRVELGPNYDLPVPIVVRLVMRFANDPTETTDFAELTYEQARSILERFRAANRELAQRFGSPEHPEFFTTRPRADEYARRPQEHVPTDAEREWLDAVVAEVCAAAAAGNAMAR